VASVYSSASMGAQTPTAKLTNRRRSVTSSAMAVQHDLSQATLSSRFQMQLNKLINMLVASEAHFVRCIKPNAYKQPLNINDELGIY
jgi:myosin heavy subunit